MTWDINKDMDKSKTYLSPSGEQAAIFIDNKWQIFHRADSIHRLFTFETKPTEDDGYGGTIKHFKDY